MKKLLLWIFILAQQVYLPAQKHDYNWVYGYSGRPGDTTSLFGGSVIDFNFRPPVCIRET